MLTTDNTVRAPGVQQYRLARFDAWFIFLAGGVLGVSSLAAFLIDGISNDFEFSASLPILLGGTFTALSLALMGQLILSVLDNAEYKAQMLYSMKEKYQVSVQKSYSSTEIMVLRVILKILYSILKIIQKIIYRILGTILGLLFIIVGFMGIFGIIPELYTKAHYGQVLLWIVLMFVLAVPDSIFSNRLEKIKFFAVWRKHTFWVRGIAFVCSILLMPATVGLISLKSLNYQLKPDMTPKEIYAKTWGDKIYLDYNSIILVYDEQEQTTENTYTTKRLYIDDLMQSVITSPLRPQRLSTYNWGELSYSLWSSLWSSLFDSVRSRFLSPEERLRDLNNRAEPQSIWPDIEDAREFKFLGRETMPTPIGSVECLVAKTSSYPPKKVWMIINHPGIYAKVVTGKTTYVLKALLVDHYFAFNYAIENAFYHFYDLLKPVVDLNIDTKKEEHDDHKFYQTLEQDNTAIEKLEENKETGDAPVHTFEGHAGSVSAVAFSVDGHMALSGGGGRGATIKLWDLSSTELIRTFNIHSKTVNSIVPLPDGQTVLSGSSDNTMKLWNISTGEIIRTFEEHDSGSVISVAVSQDGQKALAAGFGYGLIDRTETSSSSGYLNKMSLWNISTGERIRSFEGHPDKDTTRVNSVAIFPDGLKALSAGYDKTMKLWSTSTGELIRRTIHFSPVNALAVSPDGQYILSGTNSYMDTRIELKDAELQAVCSYKGLKYGIMSIVFSPDGKNALSGGDYGDNTVKLWEIPTCRLIHSFKGHFNRVNAVAFSPDGRSALSGGDDGTMKLWSLDKYTE